MPPRSSANTQPAKRPFRVPMFAKFLAACLLLAAILIVGATIVFKRESTLKARGAFLLKQVRRYQVFHDRTGRALTEATQIVAGDAALRAALTSDLAPVAADGTVAPDQKGPSPDTLKLAKAIHDRASTEHGMQPDVFIIYSGSGKEIYAPDKSPIDAKQLPSIAAVAETRMGTEFLGQLQIVDKAAYLMSAMPIRSTTSDAVIGGVMLGIKYQRIVEDYARETDDDPDRKMYPALLEGTNLMASSIPGDPSFVMRALQVDQWVRATLGDDTRDVIRLKDNDYDFATDSMTGYNNTNAGEVAKLFLLRSRASIVDANGKLPWTEICVGIATSIIIAFGLGIWVTRPIKQMVRQSRDLLAGETDLTQRIVVSSRDETADLADNINQVFARVHALATGVQNAAFQVGASSAEISAASRTMLSGLKDQTLKIESSTTAVTELSASIQQVAGNAAQATTVAANASNAVTSAVQRMEQIQAAVDDAAGKMKELGESSKRIGNIVEVIRQISEQTSMLALNASIEAAHAGEQGRGFAVVADEVSSLARRVGQSAKDIEALIQTVKEQTQAAMASMEVGTREVVGGSQLVTGTLTGLGELITVVNETANAVQEQAVVSDEIARNMDAVRHIATEVLGGSEESVVQSERLHELAFELEESIGGFNLDGARVGGTGDGGATGKRRRDDDDDAPERLDDGGSGRRRALPAPTMSQVQTKVRRRPPADKA